ncbi:MAG: MOSC domain-containing protein [Lachnospiraceae bacterium]|nr:MOSC domain-containing protein [Lachnospiraceae bacterium]
MAVIRAICISDQKGTQKYRIPEGTFTEDYGIEGDAHAGKWHRQVSLLSAEKIQEFRDKGVQVEYGAFGENLVVEGCDLRSLPVGTRFAIGEVLLEMTQIGKECHDHCAIYNVTGDCIMPREGVFAKVLHGGKVREGDTLDVIPAAPDRPFTAAVITLSDRAFRKEREDRSGPVIRDILCENGYDVTEMILLPDGEALLKRNLIRLADQRQVNVIFTTGGTGFGPRDLTPEATCAVCDRMAPGIAEAMRAESLKITKHAMLSRAAAGIRGATLIINLPGSPKACRENLDVVLPALKHGLGLLRGTDDN